MQQNVDLAQGTRINMVTKDGQELDVLRIVGGVVGLRRGAFTVT